MEISPVDIATAIIILISAHRIINLGLYYKFGLPMGSVGRDDTVMLTGMRTGKFHVSYCV